MLNILLSILAVTLNPSGDDDTANIQDALTYSAYVELQGGTFRTTETLTINGDHALRCLGATVSSTVPLGPAVQVNSGQGVQTHYVNIEGCVFDGNNATPIGIRWGQNAVSPFTGTGSIRNSSIKRMTDAGIRLVQTVQLRIEGVTSRLNGYGIHFDKVQDNGNVGTHIEGCWLKENVVGLLIEQATSVTVRDTVFEANQQEGVVVLRPDSTTHSTRNILFADNHFETNNFGRSGGPWYQFRADSAGSSIIQMLGLERNSFAVAGGSNRHVQLGKGRFREFDNEYLSPAAAAVTCVNTSVCFVASRNDKAPTAFWTLPSGAPPVVWIQHGSGDYSVWKNVNGTPTKQ